jgi:hypothetical protein
MITLPIEVIPLNGSSWIGCLAIGIPRLGRRSYAILINVKYIDTCNRVQCSTSKTGYLWTFRVFTLESFVESAEMKYRCHPDAACGSGYVRNHSSTKNNSLQSFILVFSQEITNPF